MNKVLKIKIPSIIENIRIVESFIEHAKETYDFSEEIYGNIMIAITESVNNAIVHGNKNDKEKSVNLQLDFEDTKITFTIEDEGEGFNFQNLPDPTSPDNLETIGGRGIFLIKNLADEVKFIGDGHVIKISFYLNTVY